MASSLNKAMLIGRLGKDPEVRYTQGGDAVANFSVATDESYKDREGNKQKKTEWHNIVIWGKAVQAFVEPYLHKGDMVFLEGKLQTRSWEKDGVTKYTTEINVSDIKLLQSASGDQPAARPATTNRPAARPAARPSTRPASPPVEDEDIPF